MNESCSNGGFLNNSYWELEGCASNGVITAFFLMVITAMGLPWNILVIITIIKEKLYRQPSITLLLNLALADLYLLLFPMLLVMITGFSGEFIFGSSHRVRCYACHFITVDLISQLYNCLFIVAAMSVDRLLYIYKPMQYERLAKPKVMWVVVMAMGLISLAIGFGVLTSGMQGPFMKNYLICTSIMSVPYLVILIAFGIISILVILISNLFFSVIVLKNIKAVYGGDKHGADTEESLVIWACCRVKSDTTAHQKQKRLFLVVGALTLSTILTWIPYFVVFLKDFGSTEDCSGVEFIATVLVYSQSVVHPIIETFLIADVRKPLIRMVTCSCSALKPPQLANMK